MISADTYPEENILHVKFRDKVTPDEFERFHEILADFLKPLCPGFKLISDYSGLKEMDFECWKSVGSMMERMVQAGLSEVIRVMEDPHKDIGYGILSIFHYPRNLPVMIHDNLEEVLRELEMDTLGRSGGNCVIYNKTGEPKDQRLKSHVKINQ